jgi:CheY-specific phosphatase CheX
VTTTAELQIPHKECLQQAAVNIFNSTCGMQVQPQACEGGRCNDGVITAIISLVGDLDWTIFLGLPRATAGAVAAKFAGFEIPFDSSDMGDAIGELTNILAGEVKAILDAKGVRVNLSLPSVVRAESMEVLAQSKSMSQRTCFCSPLGTLWTGLNVGRQGAPAAG